MGNDAVNQGHVKWNVNGASQGSPPVPELTPRPRSAQVRVARPQPSPSPPACTYTPMTPALQALWTQLATGPDPQAAIADWWAQARASILSPALLSIGLANASASFPAAAPAPSPPPAPDATGTWVVCNGVVLVHWFVPSTPRPAAPPALVVAVSVSDTVTLPTLRFGAAPPASAGITQFPSEFWLAGFDGAPIDTVATQGGLSVHMVSTPVSYTWDFGDGTQMTTTTLGLSATSPITHTYAQRSARSTLAVDGRYAVRVSVTYDTRFQAVGPGASPAWVDFSTYGLAPLTDSATLPYEVDELYGVLVPAPAGA